jgi:hypothetical protein
MGWGGDSGEIQTRKASSSVTHLESLLRKTEAASRERAASLKGTSPLTALLNVRNAPLLLLLIATIPFIMHHHHHAAGGDGEQGTLPHGLTRRAVQETVMGGAAAGQPPPGEGSTQTGLPSGCVLDLGRKGLMPTCNLHAIRACG